MEEVICPDMVDVIISEPMGYMLLGDRLMSSFMHARKWLKPSGRRNSQDQNCLGFFFISVGLDVFVISLSRSNVSVQR